MFEALKYMTYLFIGENMSKDAEQLRVEFPFRSAENVLRISPWSESSMVILVVDE